MSKTAIADRNLAVLLALVGILILVTASGPEVWQALRFDREAILRGGVWRLLTGSLVHQSWSHLLLNIAGLLMIAAFFGKVLNLRGWLIISGGCALGVGLGILFLDPGVSFYVGFSGVLHGLFAAGLIMERGIQRRNRALLLGLLSGKLLWEQIQGPLPGTAQAAGGNVLVDAHLYGAIAGLVLGWLLERTRRQP